MRIITYFSIFIFCFNGTTDNNNVWKISRHFCGYIRNLEIFSPGAAFSLARRAHRNRATMESSDGFVGTWEDVRLLCALRRKNNYAKRVEITHLERLPHEIVFEIAKHHPLLIPPLKNRRWKERKNHREIRKNKQLGRVSSHRFVLVILQSNLFQRATWRLGRIKGVDYERYVLWRHIFQQTSKKMECIKSGKYELDVLRGPFF